MSLSGARQAETPRLDNKRGFYLLVLLTILSIIAAAGFIIAALQHMQTASDEIIERTRIRENAELILSIARDSETGQRGFLLTGNEEYLVPYKEARRRAPAAWKTFNSFKLEPSQAELRNQIRTAFDAKFAHIGRTVSDYNNGRRSEALVAVQSGVGKRIMDRMRALVTRFKDHEASQLARAGRRAAKARWLATLLTLASALAFAASGALMYAAVRRASDDAGRSAKRAASSDQRFKATFDQAGVGFMHIDREGRPLLVNDAMCAMTGYSREDFVTSTPDSPAYPSNLFSNKANCDALVSGEVDSYRHERLSKTKDGQDIYLATIVSSVRAPGGELLFLSAIISDQTDRYLSERNLQESQERLRNLQDEFAHVARVNDMGEMAAIAHEVNQPLTAVTNYMAVANKMASMLPEAVDLTAVLQRASEQTLRAGQIIKRMRSFVERTDEHREITYLGTLIDGAIELTMIGSDRSKVEITRSGVADGARVCVDAIQFQQALIILMRNAIEAFDAGACAGKCHIDIATALDAVNSVAIVDVTDNGPGLPEGLAQNVFEPFFTSKPGNMGMGLSIARRLIDSHGGRLAVGDADSVGASFRITLPLLEELTSRAA